MRYFFRSARARGGIVTNPNIRGLNQPSRGSLPDVDCSSGKDRAGRNSANLSTRSRSPGNPLARSPSPDSLDCQSSIHPIHHKHSSVHSIPRSQLMREREKV